MTLGFRTAALSQFRSEDGVFQKTGSVIQTGAELRDEGVKVEKNGFVKCESGKICFLPSSILGGMSF